MNNGIVYLTYNSEPDIKANFNTVVSSVVYPTTITVVDNASTDGSVRLLGNADYVVHANDENSGFTAGINQGINTLLDKGVSDWIFIINPDVQCPDKWDSLLLDSLHNNERCGIVGAKLLSPFGDVLHSGGRVAPKPILLLWPRVYSVTEDVSVLSNDGLCATRFVHDTIDHNAPHKCHWVTFAVAALRVDMISEIGLLNEKYYLYNSDSDYCMRALAAGWDTWCNTTTFTHSRSASLQRAPRNTQDRGRDDAIRFTSEEEPKWLRLLNDIQQKKT